MGCEVQWDSRIKERPVVALVKRRPFQCQFQPTIQLMYRTGSLDLFCEIKRKHPPGPRSENNRFFTFSKLWLQTRQLVTKTTLHESKEERVWVLDIFTMRGEIIPSL